MRLQVEAPPGFCFRRTVRSHGWSGLAPFRAEADGTALDCTIPIPSLGARPVRWTPTRRGVRAELAVSPGRGGPVARRRLEEATRRVFGLDVDLREFHARLRDVPELAWIADCGGGRLLRAPTVFEDLVKLVLTTNCSWVLTTRMVEQVVRRYGPEAPDGTRAFPGPAALARIGERELREKARLGYRAPQVARLARSVADGEVDPEAWQRDDRDVERLKREMLALPGVGPYVAESMLKLLGRPAGLALDSWLRAEFSRVYHSGRRVRDSTIARRYARLGNWGGLAIWCDMSRDRIDGEGARPAPRGPDRLESVR